MGQCPLRKESECTSECEWNILNAAKGVHECAVLQALSLLDRIGTVITVANGGAARKLSR